MPEAVGFVGLGTMGSRMAARLLHATHPLVAFTRTPEHAEPLAARGAEIVPTAAGVAERCRFVFSCLLDTDVVERVYLGPDGILSGTTPGHVLVEHGTFAPALARRLAAAAAERGAAFVDAPVTGGPEGAEQGALVCMAGGEPSALRLVEPLLRAYCREIVRVGDAGTGLELKLVNQLLVAVHAVAAAEAAAVVDRLALPRAVAETVLTAGWGGSAMLGRSLPRVARRDFTGSGAPIGLLLEVLPLVAAVCEETDLELDLFPRAHDVLARATAAGLGPLDLAALVDAFDQRGVRG